MEGEQDPVQKSNQLAAFDDYDDPHSWGVPHRRVRVIMASLAKEVSKMEKCRRKGARHENTSMIDCYKMYKLITDGEFIIGAVYLNCQNSAFPQIVAVLRGTLLRSWRDLKANIGIVFHRLSGHKRFDMVLQVVREYVANFGPGSVCLTGHSQGAAIALLVGRKLAEEGFCLEAHLFNPPNPSLPTKLFHLPSEATVAVGVVHNVAANTLARVLRGKNTQNHDRDAFLSAREWVPNLYINEYDPICSSYIDYFELNEQLLKLKKERFGRAISSTPKSIRAILPGCRPDHLIPSASLYINGSSLNVSAHRLHQWLNLDLEIFPLYFKAGSHE